jgi:hypothetical protein
MQTAPRMCCLYVAEHEHNISPGMASARKYLSRQRALLAAQARAKFAKLGEFCCPGGEILPKQSQICASGTRRGCREPVYFAPFWSETRLNFVW